MNQFIYFEDLVANALIQKIESGEGRIISMSELKAYGKNVSEWWLTNRGLRITILDNHYYINKLFHEYSEYFLRNYNSKEEMTVSLCEGKTSDDLRKKFRSYLSVDMLLCFTQSHLRKF